MNFRLFTAIISIFPIFSWARSDSNEVQVFVERNGVLYKISDQKQIDEIIDFADLKEISPEFLDEIDMAGLMTESNEGEPKDKPN